MITDFNLIRNSCTYWNKKLHSAESFKNPILLYTAYMYASVAVNNGGSLCKVFVNVKESCMLFHTCFCYCECQNDFQKTSPTFWVLDPKILVDNSFLTFFFLQLSSRRYNYIEGTKLFIAYLNEVSQINKTSVWHFMAWLNDLLNHSSYDELSLTKAFYKGL